MPPQVKRGAPDVTGSQLPYGEATEANRSVELALQTAKQQAIQQEQQGPPDQPPEAGAPAPATPGQPLVPSFLQQGPAGISPQVHGPITLSNEEDNLLYGPTARPQEAVTTGATAPSQTVPPEVYAAMPALQAAANIPGAPKQLVGLVELLNHLLSTR